MKILVTLILCLLGAFAAPSQKRAGSVATIPFELYGNLIYLKVSINGSAPRWFDLDSGASGCIVDKTLAKQLRLKTEGKAAGTGAGKGTYEMTFAKNVTYDLGGLALKVGSSYVIDLSSNITFMGRPLDGIIGYDLFERYVVLIDYDAQVIRLYDSESYQYEGKGEIIPIKLSQKTPHFTGLLKVAGREAANREFLIDTGSGDAVDDDLIAESTAPKLETIAGVGLGKEFKTAFGPIEWLKMGSLSVGSAFGVTGGVALIGGGVLHRFTVILDYRRNRMILEPNRFYNEAFVSDASGARLRFVPVKKQFRVHSVRKGSAAEEAGLHENDLITAVDGHVSSDFSLEQIQRMFTNAGHEYRLTVLRSGKTLMLNLRLRKMF